MAENLDEVVEPITGLVEWQVALMAQDREQTEEEDSSVELQSLQGYTFRGLGRKHFKVQ